MAKKKRQVKEEPPEEYEFKPSEFDEREFMLKDLYGTKVLLVVTAMAIAVGAIAAAIYNMSSGIWYAGMMISFATVILMKPVFLKLGFRVDLLDTKTMLGNYLLFLMLALGICIVGINAPF
ncbi:MAG: hypothetical protein LBG62_03090 [Candidatus Methanoplasma sp.]|jgi:hypothetical protein|nr:hypothetical protein [Candidatus Methanoplasma sp.]